MYQCHSLLITGPPTPNLPEQGSGRNEDDTDTQAGICSDIILDSELQVARFNHLNFCDLIPTVLGVTLGVILPGITMGVVVLIVAVVIQKWKLCKSHTGASKATHSLQI